MQHHGGLGEAAWPGGGFGKRMNQRLRQSVVGGSDNVGACNRRWRHGEGSVIIGLALEKARLAPGGQDATPERPVMDRAPVQRAGEVGADPPPPPTAF